MNKILVSLAASLAVLGVVFAQVPGGIQEAPRPGQTPFPLGQGGGMRTGGGGSSVAASGNYVYVVSGNTLYQFSRRGRGSRGRALDGLPYGFGLVPRQPGTSLGPDPDRSRIRPFR